VRKVYDADNEVLDGIRRVAQGLTTGTLYIHESCEGLIAEMANYRWDEKAQERGEDKPVKDADHGPDALRYAVARILGPQPRRALRVVR
jgi:phage terminase large subunit